jgi:hypothetical protein
MRRAGRHHLLRCALHICNIGGVMASEMVDRVARAIFEANAGKWWHGISWEEYAPEYSSNRESYEREARAAIEAMRVPTAEMIEAAMIQPHLTVVEAGGIIAQGQSSCRLDWQAMINEAL